MTTFPFEISAQIRRPYSDIRQRVVIRTLDLSLAVVFLVASLPFMAAISFLILIFDGRPIFFRQVRYGFGMKEITVIKFRTMHVGAEKFENKKVELLKEPNVQTENDHRVTKIGRILRRLSLDELPELLVVLSGQMSLVGPRPLIKAEVDRFPSKYLTRFAVPPGITGLAQVSGRSKLSVWDILSLDLLWVERYSIGLYLRILWNTFAVIFRIREAW